MNFCSDVKRMAHVLEHGEGKPPAGSVRCSDEDGDAIGRRRFAKRSQLRTGSGVARCASGPAGDRNIPTIWISLLASTGLIR